MSVYTKNKLPMTRDNVDPASVALSIEASLKPDVVREVVASAFVDNKTKLSGEALTLLCEVGKLLIVEGALRASMQALSDGSPSVDIEHAEKCLPQLMLDFP